MSVLLAVSSPASGQETAVEPGKGNAYAQGFKVDPRSGRLSLGIGFGLALAGHQNNVAQAESRSVDLGIVGDTLAGEGCDGGDPTLPEEDQPQHLSTRSTDDDAGTEHQETEYQVDKRVYSDDSPLAYASATTAAAGDPAVIHVGATHARTESGVIDGTRVARAITDVSSLSFAGGQVVLRGLRWEAGYQTAPTESTTANFTVEGVEIAGQELPIPDDNPLASLAEANAALEPLGFRIDPPTTRTASGIAFVDPMRIGIVSSEVRESLLGPVLSAAQPVREDLFQAIIEQDCGNATYILVADIVLGSVTGAGSLNLELGGVTATSDDLQASSFLSDLESPRTATPAPATPAIPSVQDDAAASTDPTAPSSVPRPSTSTAPEATTTSTSLTSGDETASGVDTVSGSRGGPLAGVGLAGLALLAALAEGDRRKMRRAQRTTPMEVMA